MPDVVVVEAGERRWAVPAARVREVAALATVTPVPSAPPMVVGLTQLRGQILPVLLPGGGDAADARAPRPPRPGDPLLVVELGPARAALWVDRVLGLQPDAGTAEPLDVGALFDQLRASIAAR